MKYTSVVLAAMSALAVSGLARAAEDHSAHQHLNARGGEHAEHPMLEPAANDQHSAEHEHADHQMQASPQNEHAHHPQANDEPTESERAHVPPPPPQNVMHDMSKEKMVELMQMEDTAPVGMVVADRLEWRKADAANAVLWNGHAWYGNDYNKLWFKTEGEHVQGQDDIRAELLWDRIFSRWWSVQAGVRHDFTEGPERTWAAIGVQGLAAYFFETEATVYVGEEGRTAARFSGEYDLLLTQRWILQPEVELNIYGKDDLENGIGSGLADAEVALRLRYEIRRELAPYVGIVWSRQFGETANLRRTAGHDTSDVQLVAGLRVWF
jgi:copper resistance protein B